jgi:hypothetical protein
VSIFIDGGHLDNLGRMCVKPVIMELLALSSKVRCTYITLIRLGVSPPYPLLTAKRNKEPKSKNTKHNHLDFYQKSLKIVLKDLLHLDKNKDGLQVDIPAFNVGDIKGRHPMACHYGAFAADIKIILPV